MVQPSFHPSTFKELWSYGVKPNALPLVLVGGVRLIGQVRVVRLVRFVRHVRLVRPVQKLERTINLETARHL